MTNQSPLTFNIMNAEPTSVVYRVTTKALEDTLKEIAASMELKDVIDVCITAGEKNERGVVIPIAHIWFDSRSKNVSASSKVTEITGRSDMKPSAELNKFLKQFWYRNDKDKARFVRSNDGKCIGCALNLEKIFRHLFDIDNRKFEESYQLSAKDKSELRPISLTLDADWGKNGNAPIAIIVTKSYKRLMKRDLTPKSLRKYND